MALQEDYVDALATEVLSEMAGSFFGSRKQVEDSIKILNHYADALRKKEAEVEAGACCLAYLMVDREELTDFYRSAGIEIGVLPLEKKLTDRFLPGEMPGALTAKGVFQKLLFHAYERVQKLCDEYMNGKKAEDLEKDDPNTVDSAYRIVMGMCQVINEKISKINAEMRPGQTLRYFKRFSPGTEIKENITGGTTFGCSGSECRINQALALETVDPDSFGLKKFPELPPADRIRGKLADSCKKIWTHRQTEVRLMLDEVKKSYKKQ